jgi:hypothetical protein
MDEGVAVLAVRCRYRRRSTVLGLRLTVERPAMIVRMVLTVLGILTRPVQNRHSRAGRKSIRTAEKRGSDLTWPWLIFRKRHFSE